MESVDESRVVGQKEQKEPTVSLEAIRPETEQSKPAKIEAMTPAALLVGLLCVVIRDTGVIVDQR